jgi:hypothetical protein
MTISLGDFLSSLVDVARECGWCVVPKPCQNSEPTAGELSSLIRTLHSAGARGACPGEEFEGGLSVPGVGEGLCCKDSLGNGGLA